MLQWMGGSRRKVATSRKSTQKRQKQYFEQRKRQLQRQLENGPESHTDGVNTCDQNHKKHRSLDILNLLNLSTAAQELNCHMTKFPPEIFPKKATPASLCDFDEAGTSLDYQVEAVSPKEIISHAHLAQNNDSTSYGVKSAHWKITEEQQPSVLDLLGDDGPDDESRACPAYEAHVAFSVEGLGKVATETPVNSPPQVFSCSLPVNPAKRAHASKKHNFVLDDMDLRVASVMQNANSPPGGSSMELPVSSNCNMNPFINPKEKLFAVEDYMQHNGSGSDVRNYFGDKFFSGEGGNEIISNARSSRLDENFLYETKYDKPLKNCPYPFDDNFAGFSKFEDHVLPDFAWTNPHRMKRRDAEAARDCFNISESITPYSLHGRSKNGRTSIASDVARCPMVEKYGGFQDSNNQPAWSYLVAEDTTDNLSLLSEESCSSTAVMGGTTIETSQNPIARENTGRRIDDLSKPFQEYTVEGLYPKETRYMKWNGSLKEENAAGLGKQIRISRATHNPNSASEERSGKDDSWLFEEGYKLAGMNSSFCSIGQTGASNASGWTDGLSFESSKHKVPGEFSPSEDYSSGKCAFRKQFCHAQSPVFSDIFPGLISLGSKTAGIPPHLSLFAGSHGDGESLDIAAEEGDNEDWESKTKMPLKDETLMSRMNDSSENRKQVIALESNEISGKFEEGSDTTSSAEGTPSANVPDKLGRSVDERECFRDA